MLEQIPMYPGKRNRIWVDAAFCTLGCIFLFQNILLPALFLYLEIKFSYWEILLFTQIIPLLILLCATHFPDSDIPLADKLLLRFSSPFPLKIICVNTLFLVFSAPIFAFAISEFAKFFSVELPSQDIVHQIKNTHGANLICIFISTTICAPVFEEISFRRIFYAKMEQLTSPACAALTTAFLFSALHRNLLHAASLFVMSLVLQGALRKTNSLYVPILIHAFFNSISILLICL